MAARAAKARAERQGGPAAAGLELPRAERTSVAYSDEDGYHGTVMLRVPTPMSPDSLAAGGNFDARLLGTEWQAQIASAVENCFAGIAPELRAQPGAPDVDFADAFSQAGADASAAVQPFVQKSIGDHLFPDGFTLDGVLDFAKEYPVLAAMGSMLGTAATAAYLSETIKSKGVLSLDAGPVKAKVNLQTMDWEFLLRFKMKF